VVSVAFPCNIYAYSFFYFVEKPFFMPLVRIASFNCENLFVRYRFDSRLSDKKKASAIKHGFIIDPALFQRITPIEKALTAQVIQASKADIVALMEVENMDTLKNFCDQYLSEYRYKALIDGNDPRLIDVALISKIPFDNLVTHQTMRLKGSPTPVFSRDCLEVNFTIAGKSLSLFINHFKSMYDRRARTPAQGRALTAPKRIRQAQAVLQILKNKFNGHPARHLWMVLGDLNDYNDEHTSLKALLTSPWMVNLLEKELPPEQQWTYYWDNPALPEKEKYRLIDYLLPSRALYKRLVGKPVIIRSGLITKATRYKGKRFKGVTALIGASDHCLIAASFQW
jgi:endonuclease/exonuclease/phosphatase family metal-dependent hydrolase